MQEFNCSEQLAAAHHRLHDIEQWPDGPRKRVALDAVQSALNSLLQHPAMPQETFDCVVCRGRIANLKIMERRDATQVQNIPDVLGAWRRAG